MKLVRAWPFMTLAAVTILIGIAWHAAGAARDDGGIGQAMFAIVSIIGAPFIAAQRLSRELGTSPLRPVVALLLGLAPYLIADLVLRARRR